MVGIRKTEMNELVRKCQVTASAVKENEAW
jgi:hypothetical protein